LKAKQSFLTMQYSLHTTSPLYMYKAGHSPTDFLNCDNSGTQDEQFEIIIIRDCLSCTFIPLMFGYINLYDYSINLNLSDHVCVFARKI